MPPRTPSLLVASSALARPARSGGSNIPKCLVEQCSANFSTTANREGLTKLRHRFIEWLNTKGKQYRSHRPGDTNYAGFGNTPFPLNTQFKSMEVLSDQARELIWKKIMRDGETIKAVSAELGVDIRRVAAVVRLKEVEKDWEAKGKKLAKPYANAVLEMLRTKHFSSTMRNEPFEPINELHVHPYTMQQLFWPTSESRHFTREDAAEAFHHKLLSADKRAPHPELIQMEREIHRGTSPHQAAMQFKNAVMESERKAAQKQLEKASIVEQNTTRRRTKRFEFRFEQFNSELVGPKGKARKAVGWRYGAPYYDRAKGEIKIPTSVP